MPERTLHLAVDDPKNANLLTYMATWHRGCPAIASPESTPKDPYLEHGSHPDRVRWVWDTLGKALPVDCRCLLYGSPALVAPVSGAVLAVAWGTAYILRVPAEVVPIIQKEEAGVINSLTSNGAINVTERFGDDWVFGLGKKEEPSWCRAVYDAVGNPSRNQKV